MTIVLEAVHDPHITLGAVVDEFTVFVPPENSLDFSDVDNSMYLGAV